MNRKAIVLLSGGLDSILAVRLMQEQGIEVLAVNFFIEFASCGGRDGDGSAKKAALALGVPLKIFDITAEYLEMFKKPRHGYGANINPCVDCKIFMIKKAKAYMNEAGASFLVTGEVLGERPMSQRRDALNLIDKEAAVKGILLRPLSAGVLEPTIPEKEGIVDRKKLFDIVGRSRKRQIELAGRFGLEYPNPAGGCLLTDPAFTVRVKDLIAHNEVTIDNLKLLKWGRHFRLSDATKLIVGRDKEENDILEQIATAEDLIFKLKDRQGPISILRGKVDEEIINIAARFAAYHTKFRNEPALDVNYWMPGSEERMSITVEPAKQDEVERVRI